MKILFCIFFTLICVINAEEVDYIVPPSTEASALYADWYFISIYELYIFILILIFYFFLFINIFYFYFYFFIIFILGHMIIGFGCRVVKRINKQRLTLFKASYNEGSEWVLWISTLAGPLDTTISSGTQKSTPTQPRWSITSIRSG